MPILRPAASLFGGLPGNRAWWTYADPSLLIEHRIVGHNLRLVNLGAGCILLLCMIISRNCDAGALAHCCRDPSVSHYQIKCRLSPPANKSSLESYPTSTKTTAPPADRTDAPNPQPANAYTAATSASTCARRSPPLPDPQAQPPPGTAPWHYASTSAQTPHDQ